jgi:hypothetical protein
MSLDLDVLEDRTIMQADHVELHPGICQEVELGARAVDRLVVDAQQASDPEPQTGRGKRAVRCGASQPPTSRIAGGEVPRRDTNYYEVWREIRVVVGPAVYSARFQPIPPWSLDVFFYELREGDDDIFADVLLVREEEMDADTFFELVQSIRINVQDTFRQDTLIEAIAEELEQDHGFIPISDDRLTASVNVSKQEDDNYLASIDSDDDEDGPDYRGIFVDMPRDRTRPN